MLRSISDAERKENEIPREMAIQTLSRVQARKRSKPMHDPSHKTVQITSVNCDKTGHVKGVGL